MDKICGQPEVCCLLRVEPLECSLHFFFEFHFHKIWSIPWSLIHPIEEGMECRYMSELKKMNWEDYYEISIDLYFWCVLVIYYYYVQVITYDIWSFLCPSTIDWRHWCASIRLYTYYLCFLYSTKTRRSTGCPPSISPLVIFIIIYNILFSLIT